MKFSPAMSHRDCDWLLNSQQQSSLLQGKGKEQKCFLHFFPKPKMNGSPRRTRATSTRRLMMTSGKMSNFCSFLLNKLLYFSIVGDLQRRWRDKNIFSSFLPLAVSIFIICSAVYILPLSSIVQLNLFFHLSLSIPLLNFSPNKFKFISILVFEGQIQFESFDSKYIERPFCHCWMKVWGSYTCARVRSSCRGKSPKFGLRKQIH